MTTQTQTRTRAAADRIRLAAARVRPPGPGPGHPLHGPARGGLAALYALGLALLAGCAQHAPPPAPPIEASAPAPRPDLAARRQAELRHARPERAREAALVAQQAGDTPASRAIRAQLEAAEKALLARGLLRSDGGTEIEMTPERLTEDFVQIALRDEYMREGGQLVPRTVPAPLRRWTTPVRLFIEFGPSVAPAQQARDRAEIAAYAARLSAATGHPVTLEPAGGNFAVLILSEDERRAIGPRLAALVPGIPDSDIAAMTGLSPQNYCTVFAYSRGNATTYAQAVALIRSETPPRLRRSCVHEEIAQGLGLANDSPTARPSIFNDDEEFGLLTPHDELLLKILYDPRLRPGMTEAEARPIVLAIARELLAAGRPQS